MKSEEKIFIIYRFNYGDESTGVFTFGIPDGINDAELCIKNLKENEDIDILHIVKGKDYINEYVK